METYFAPFPENDMQTSLQVIDGLQGNIGSEMRTVTSMVAGRDNTVIYYDHWEDGYEDDISSPTQATTQVWGDGNSTNGIPPNFTNDVINAGTIINLEDTIDVLRNQVIFEYDGRDKIGASQPISLGRAQYPISPGEVIAEAGTALDINLHGTNYIMAVGWGMGAGPYTNEVFEYSAMYIIADYDYSYVEVDKDSDGTYETTAWLDEGEPLFVNGGVHVGARARGNKPFQCHMVTGDILANYETRWYTQWPVDKWSADYYSAVGGRSNTAVAIQYNAIVFFYNANTSSIDVICETAASTTTITVAGSSASSSFRMPLNAGARFHTTNGMAFFASEVFDASTPAYSGQLQDYDWGFSVLPADALTTMGIVSWGPGYGVTGSGTTNGNPAWVIAVSNTTLYVDYDGDPATGPLVDSLGNHYNFSTNMQPYQAVYLYDNTDTNQTGMRFYTLDGTKISSAWGEDPRQAAAGLPYLDAGMEIMPFPTILAKKYSMLLIDVNTNGVPDPGDSLQFTIDVINVGFATANNVILQDNPPSNCTAYVTNSSSVNGVAIFDDLPPRLTRFPFDENGYNVGTIDIGHTTKVQYISLIVSGLPTNFSGFIHNNATVGDSNGNWYAQSFTNVQVGGLVITKTASTTNLLEPGDTLTYIISIVNTGQFTYTGMWLEDTLPVGVTDVSGSTRVNYPIGLTNTVMDRFPTRAYTNHSGTILWRDDWQEEGESDGASGGKVGVTLDQGVYPAEAYALFIGGSNVAIRRSADLSGHSAAHLSFNYRRDALDDANDYVDLFISTNGWASSNYLVRFAGAANETNTYRYTNIEVSAYISTNTAVKFVSSRSPTIATNDRVWVDDICFTLTGSNVTFAAGDPTLLFQGLRLPPGTNLTVSFQTIVDNPPTATQLVNTARVRAEQHQTWLYAYHVTNYIDARAALDLYKTNNPGGQVGPGSNIAYTIRVVNTGDVAQTSLRMEDLLPSGVTYVPGSAYVWRPYQHTNDVRDWFDAKAYTNDNGNVNWAGDWTETGDDSSPTSGTVLVANDGASVPGHVYALRINGTPSIQRAANLGGGYTNATLSFEWRRDTLSAATDYVSVYASSNGGTAWTEVGRVVGPGTDGGYYVSNINISAWVSTGTVIRFTGVGMSAGEYVWFDDVRVRFSSSRASNSLAGPPDLFADYTLPPHTSMVVTLSATVDDPATSTQLVNTARVQSDQHPDWLNAYATNWLPGTVGLSLSKTSSLAGGNWPLYYTNTYTITLSNTGQLAQTGITVTDALPAGVTYVPGSTVVVYPTDFVTNFSTNVTTNAFSETVSDHFNRISYANNDGSENWANDWTETGDNANPTSGSVLVGTDVGPVGSVNWTNTNADDDYITRLMLMTNAPGRVYTNVMLSFSYRRVNWDTTDFFTFTISTNNFGGQSNEVYRVGGSAVNNTTDAGFTTVSTNITGRYGTNLAIRLRGGSNFAAGDAFDVDYVTITYSGYDVATNVTSNTFWEAATNAGAAPPPVASGYTLPPGQSMTVTLSVTLDLPTTYTQFLNTAYGMSLQQGPLQASATDRVLRVGIGDFVWYDANTNGIQNAGEGGITGVTVRLYDGRTNLLATTTTTTNGYYLFSGWPATNFFVEFVAPSNYWFTLQDQGASDTNDSDANPATGRTAIFTLTGASNDTTRDAGFYIPPASVGDWAWFDANTNGIQNAGETGVAGVVVRLYTSDSNLVSTTTNTATGYYLFSGLMPGSYFLSFAAPSGYVFTLQDQGASDTNDSDVSQSTGLTPVFYLAPGTNELKWDVGFVRPTTGLRITKTSNAGGSCWDPGETGIYSIVVANTGAFSQVGVTVQDTFPVGETFVSNSITVNGPGAGSTGSPPTLAYGWTLAAGQAMTVTVRFAVNMPAVTNLLVNQATTYSATHPTLSAYATDCVVYADLGVIKDVNDATPNEYQIMEYSILITNRGPDTATAVTIEDILPDEVQYNSHSNGAYDANTHLWTIGTLPVGATTTLWINCTVRENTKFMYITNWATVHSLNQYDPISTNNLDDAMIHPTLVVLSRFEVLSRASGPIVEWETSYEHGTVGFQLYRKDDGAADFVRLNERLLPGVITAPQGGIYRFADSTAKPDRAYTYRLDEVTADGMVNSYGPFTVTIPPAPAGVKALRTTKEEPYARSARVSSVTQGRVAQAVAQEKATTAVPVPARMTAPRKTDATLDENWPPVKVRTTDAGVYRLDAMTLATAIGGDEAEVADAIAGHAVSLSIGGETATYLEDGTSLCYYAEAIDSLYTTVNVCRLTWTNGTTMSEVGGILPVPVEGGHFTDTAHAEQDHFALLAVEQDAESDYWYWNYLIGGDPTYGSADYDLDSPDVAADGGDAQLAVRLMGGTTTGVTNEHHVTVALNGTPVGEVSWSGLTPCEITNTVSRGLLRDENTVTVSALLDSGVPWSLVYVDSFTLSYPRSFRAVNDALPLRGDANAVVSVAGFSSPDIRVLDLADPHRPVRVTAVTVDAYEAGYRASFVPHTPETPYIVYAATRTPSSVVAHESGDLLSDTNTARYVVITTPDLAGPAQVLADRRAADGLPARVVLMEDIYDGFSSGREQPTAIRDFLQWARDHWNTADTNGFYVLLAGEGTFDYRDVMGVGQNKVPAMMASTSQGLCASDGWYVDFDDDHVPEMAIGRLPALTAEELQGLVDKVVRFETSEGGSWRQTVLLTADNPDAGGNFDGASDAVGALAPRDYSLEKVYLSALSTADARAALRTGIDNGAAFVNYFGHAGIDRMANEGLLLVDDAGALSNSNRLAIVVSLTCAMGQFALPGFDSLGESLLMSTGGAAAVWSPNGVSLNHYSFGLADRFYRAIFRDGVGILGDATRQAVKDYLASGGALQVPDSYNLLGDPALRLQGASFASRYALWRNATFTSNELADSAISGDESDPDGDGLGNLWEYAFGWNPHVADAGDVMAILRDYSGIPPADYDATFRFQRRKVADGVDYRIEGSTDLATWSDADRYVVGTTTNDDGNGLTETVNVFVSVPSGDVGAGLFLRLVVDHE